VCDLSNSACCTSTCQYASAGTVCRAAVDSTCDYTETCTGTNATCPEDKTAPDGESCGSDGLACASGTCTSLNLQCQTAGASMNLTAACEQRNDQSCVVTCKDPDVSYVNSLMMGEILIRQGSMCCSTNGSGGWITVRYVHQL
jgi:hypothetical protein